MSPQQTLAQTEAAALSNQSNFKVNVTGGNAGATDGKKKKKLGAFGSSAFLTILFVVVIILLFTLMPTMADAVLVQTVEATDVQCADGVRSKIVTMQQALAEGKLPSNTVDRLKQDGVLVGNATDGGFVEAANGTAVQIDGKVVTASAFETEALNNTKLYAAIKNATYSCAAYYYDAAGQKVLRDQIGTTGNNYSASTDFDETTSKLMGEGNNVSSNYKTWEWVKCDEDGDGVADELCKEYYDADSAASSVAASKFVDDVKEVNKARTPEKATMNAADTLKVADMVSKEQRSMLMYVGFMENISKMKAGYGGIRTEADEIAAAFSTMGAVTGTGSNINEVMNRLYEPATTEVVDVATGEKVTVTGSMVESPSMYAMLTGGTVDAESVQNYSTERILKRVENSLGGGTAEKDTISGTVASTKKKLTAIIGRFVPKEDDALPGDLSTVTPIVEESLYNNSFKETTGYVAGELLAEGAVNVGRLMAKASGASAGSEDAVKKYARVSNEIIAMEAEVDRMNRSPLDITSKNTFLGSIVYKMAVSSIRSGGILNKMAAVSRVTASAVSAILPSARADEGATNFLTNFGSCETLGDIGASGTAECSTIATFDTTTYSGIYGDPEFEDWKKDNVDCNENDVCRVKSGSSLEKYINYNELKRTPDGVTDGDIVQAVREESSVVPFIAKIVNLFAGGSPINATERRAASGEMFVNSAENSDWSTYKYAQRYISLARAQDSLRQFDGDTTAYNFEGFGVDNPIIAYIEEHENSVIASE